jgi:hypothetical protein
MLKWRIVVLTLFMSIPVGAAKASDDSMLGKFTFNWFTDPNKVKCTRIDDQLASMFLSPQFHCDLKPHRNTASGVPASVCSNTNGSSEYIIFSTFVSCEQERKTQAANGN